MAPTNELVSNRQFRKLNDAHKHKKRIKPDAVIYSVASNDVVDVASYNKARIFRIHRGDIWFVSNIALPRGGYVYLGLNMVETDAVFNSAGYHLVLIKGRSDSHLSPYRYRYQARYINSKGALGKVTKRIEHKKQVPIKTQKQAAGDPRNHPRKTLRRSIFFYSHSENYKGVMMNLSRSGAFIKTNNNLDLGQTIEIAIPEKYVKKGYRLYGNVVRLEQNGVGVKLTRLLNRESSRKPRLFYPLNESKAFRIPDLGARDVGNKFHTAKKENTQWERSTSDLF